MGNKGVSTHRIFPILENFAPVDISEFAFNPFLTTEP